MNRRHLFTVLLALLVLPATYSSQGSNYTATGGSMSDGTIA